MKIYKMIIFTTQKCNKKRLSEIQNFKRFLGKEYGEEFKLYIIHLVLMKFKINGTYHAKKTVVIKQMRFLLHVEVLASKIYNLNSKHIFSSHFYETVKEEKW